MSPTHEKLYALSEGKVSTWYKEHLERKAQQFKDNNMERCAGFYWIKRHNEWIVAEYKEQKPYKSYPLTWFFAGTSKTIWLPSIQEIDETLITRNVDCPTTGRY